MQRLAGLVKEGLDVSGYISQDEEGNFYVDQEDPDTGERIAQPYDEVTFNYKGSQYTAMVTNVDRGRNGVYLLKLDSDDESYDDDEDN